MRRDRVLLLQPRVGDMDAFRDRPTPPLSLLSAASGLRPEFDVELIDARVDGDWEARLDAALRDEPVAVGLTTLAGSMVGSALELARAVRVRSSAPLVWGGIQVTMVPDQAIAHRLVDFAVLGEGERALPALLRRLRDGAPADDVPGVWSRRSGARPPRAAPLDFTRVPPPAYDLVDMRRYLYTFRGLRFLDYPSSRGCPRGCTYCHNHVSFGGHYAAKPADQVLDELRAVRRAVDFDAVYFVDDNFLLDRERGLAIVEALAGEGLGYSLQGVDLPTLHAMDDAELRLLEDSGLQKVTVGVEVGTDTRRRAVGKWGTVDQVREVMARLADRRFSVLASFIVGFPGESRDETRQTMQLAFELQRMGRNFRLPHFFLFTPVYGTPIADEMARAGYRFPGRFEQWAEFEWDVTHVAGGDPARKRELEAIAFLSRFVDRKVDDYGSRHAVAALYRLYRPLAIARLRTGLLRGLPEKRLYEAIRELT